jgi:protein SCO1
MDCWEQKIASMYRTAYLIFISLALGLACSSKTKGLPYFNTPDFTPHFITDRQDVRVQINHQIDTFRFTNQENQIITQSVIENKIHVANFIFTSCGSICPVMTDHMKLVRDAFGNDTSVVILSYSVTPWIDDVPRLKAYADQQAISSTNWHLLTGKKSDIYRLARQSYFAEEDLGFTKDSTEFLHTEHFLLVDQTKRIRGIYNGTLALDMRQLIDDIKLLQAGD